tara:strand:- start:255 stop:458 length:204 start_codon:yes stop_codon:yes gene_type:complete
VPLLDFFKRSGNDEIIDRVNKHRKVMPVVMDFVDACDSAVNDGKLSREDSQKLMKQYWKVIKAVKEK